MRKPDTDAGCYQSNDGHDHEYRRKGEVPEPFGRAYDALTHFRKRLHRGSVLLRPCVSLPRATIP
jgi:hypothetical protein